MPYTPISAVITPEQYSTIAGHILAVRQALAFLQTLTPADRRSLPKMGPARVGFVDAAKRTAQQFPQIMPGVFPIPEFLKDTDLLEMLVQIRDLIRSLDSDVDDTVLGLGAETYRQALRIYDEAEDNAATVPGLKPLYDEMAEYFERAPQDDTPAPTPTPTPAP